MAFIWMVWLRCRGGHFIYLRLLKLEALTMPHHGLRCAKPAAAVQLPTANSELQTIFHRPLTYPPVLQRIYRGRWLS